MPSNAHAEVSTSSRLPAPFLKWAGGKRQLLPALLKALPRGRLHHYAEPFLGGGAVFFELVRLDRVDHATLGDTNVELITTYQAVRDDVESVIEALAEHRNDAEHYYAVRALDPETLPPARRAARTIFLNRCGFNGLYRVNSAGRFNVPFGRHANPTICDPETLRAASSALQRAELRVADFGEIAAQVPTGGVAYFDPPYVPLSSSSSFTSYTRDGFNLDDQRRLRDLALDLKRRGVHVVLSNSSAAVVRDLYASGFTVKQVTATRAINCQAKGRGTVRELLIK